MYVHNSINVLRLIFTNKGVIVRSRVGRCHSGYDPAVNDPVGTTCTSRLLGSEAKVDE